MRIQNARFNLRSPVWAVRRVNELQLAHCNFNEILSSWNNVWHRWRFLLFQPTFKQESLHELQSVCHTESAKQNCKVRCKLSMNVQREIDSGPDCIYLKFRNSEERSDWECPSIGRSEGNNFIEFNVKLTSQINIHKQGLLRMHDADRSKYGDCMNRLICFVDVCAQLQVDCSLRW